jgi:hypothetical protein
MLLFLFFGRHAWKYPSSLACLPQFLVACRYPGLQLGGLSPP